MRKHKRHHCARFHVWMCCNHGCCFVLAQHEYDLKHLKAN